MNTAVLFSGGKDSTFTLYNCIKNKHNVKCLITIKSENKASYMFHTPNINITKLQSESLGIPLLEFNTKGEKETELNDLRNAFIEAKKLYKIDCIAAGALYSNYQADRIKKLCDELDLKCCTPLWQNNQIQHLKNMLASKFNIIIQSIAADGLTKKWLGRIIDTQAISELETLQKKIGLNPAGEGGEYESLVLDCPFYKKELVIEKSSIAMESECVGQLIIKKIKMKDKE